MFPIRDHNPSGRTPYVTYALMVINIVVFVSYWPLMSDQRALYQSYADWAMVPRWVMQEGMYHTMATSMFLHGGVMHLAGNMLFLWIFGDNVEDEMGPVWYLLFYLLCGIGAGAAQVLAAPDSLIPTVGASGAIAGVMGGYLLLFPKARVDILLILIVFFRIFPVPAWLMLGLWIGLQVVNGIGADPNAGGVAYRAHIGGFVIGVVLALPLFWRLGGPTFWARTHGHPPHPEATYEFAQSRVPKVRQRK